ncbi:ABC transporter ATP-binding protein [Mycoplana rhizolycopersici]|jgi:spermidine/putrescine ABC transporter ATP-binding subunit|uniref:Spermidine/putrescine import ATP-binding protein PotA n=1 Tax=Mycoplana rhizolycopersici TaxID=2746702 RepID=A0ABX2QC41_9HYPH|nr:ABC transporter ATP-binding protein [Rhizobium rhizolycopersici]NVP55302.1 ABC transporter ATP-binding protein [Rhizobium rhizolycopersici]
MNAETSPILRIESVAKNFGPVVAVDGVSIDVLENEFFALLGPSGCGKTTLLRMLAGFETPSAGRILLEGRDISPLPPEKRPLNLMFQSYALFPHMTVRQNLCYGLEMERLDKAEIRRRVDETMATTDLTQFADRKPEQLSGGQKQRVALARALVKRPKVLLLDEPLGALDKKLREKMQLELKRMQNEAGITFVIVTHDQEEALVMADRMAILKDGRLLQCGSPEEIYEAPADRFVANFIGVMNFIDGRVTEDRVFEAEGLRLAVVNARPGPATLAARPENIAVGAPGERLAGTIADIAYHGLDRVLHVKTPAAPVPLQVRVPAQGGTAYQVGDALSLKIDPARCRLFAGGGAGAGG